MPDGGPERPEQVQFIDDIIKTFVLFDGNTCSSNNFTDI
jgi:hypothetical protein